MRCGLARAGERTAEWVLAFLAVQLYKCVFSRLAKFMDMKSLFLRALAGAVCGLSLGSARAETDVYLLGVPDYAWHAGCFGTACGNLMGYWDRQGLPNFYTGPTAGGLAPLSDRGTNVGIRAMWASKAGFDGRPADQPGHIDDYWGYYNSDASFSYESTAADPFQLAGRSEHAPDCVGDFIGVSQKKWTNMNNECDGNIDAYSFVYWDAKGDRRVNYQPTTPEGKPLADIQSGLRSWARFRGYAADVFTQLTDFNPTTAPNKGFTFEDLKAEIDAGYPVLLFLQPFTQYFRALTGMPRANPPIHGMLAYGYVTDVDGTQVVRYRTSWGSGDNVFSAWNAASWQAGLPVRGVIGFHPRPKITGLSRSQGMVTIRWEGPSSQLYDAVSQTVTPVHRYVVERSLTLNPPDFVALNEDSPTTEHSLTVPDCCDTSAFFRVRLVGP